MQEMAVTEQRHQFLVHLQLTLVVVVVRLILVRHRLLEQVARVVVAQEITRRQELLEP
jgi:hypothetical protein